MSSSTQAWMVTWLVFMASARDLMDLPGSWLMRSSSSRTNPGVQTLGTNCLVFIWPVNSSGSLPASICFLYLALTRKTAVLGMLWSWIMSFGLNPARSPDTTTALWYSCFGILRQNDAISLFTTCHECTEWHREVSMLSSHGKYFKLILKVVPDFNFPLCISNLDWLRRNSINLPDPTKHNSSDNKVYILHILSF